jgi:LysR substrate binding domain
MPNPRPPEHAGLNLAVKQYRRSSSWERKVRSSTASGVDILSRAIERFEAAAAGATVQLSTTPFEDRLGRLRRCEVDLVVTRLPLDQPDIVVGPVLSAADQRVVMVGRTHPLAGRADLSVEDLADHDVRRPYGLTAELAEATCPPRTPSGRRIRFVDAAVDANAELLDLLARGRLVHPTVAPFAEPVQHPDVAAIPLRDLPPSTCALASLRDVGPATVPTLATPLTVRPVLAIDRRVPPKALERLAEVRDHFSAAGRDPGVEVYMVSLVGRLAPLRF